MGYPLQETLHAGSLLTQLPLERTMPRIFHVTFTREFDVTILAEDEKELRAALKEQEHEIEDWTDVDWDFSVTRQET